MRVLAACSLGGAGHLGPLLPLLAARGAGGDEILVVGPQGIADLVVAAGHRFWGGAEPAADLVDAVRARLALVPAPEAAVLSERELFGRLATDAMLPDMAMAFDKWQPDVVLREPCEYASAVVAARRRVPCATVAISLADIELSALDIAAPVIDRRRPGLADTLRGVPYLTRFPASMDPPAFPRTLRYRDDTRPAADALGDRWPDVSAPLVYVTMGTVLGAMEHAAGAYEAVLSAVAGLDARVLVAVGPHFDPGEVAAPGPHVHVAQWVDQTSVMSKADLVVCHGGSGTVLDALTAGVPLVVVPSFADQFENGHRVAEAGAGLTVEPTAPSGVAGPGRRPPSPADAPRIARAIERVLAEGSYLAAACRLATEMAGHPPPSAILDRLLAPPG